MSCWRTALKYFSTPLCSLILLLLLVPRPWGAESAVQTPALSQKEDGYRPSPPVPAEALFLGEWGDVELTIVAGPDGKIIKASISKPSTVKLFDERIRRWVETNWNMGRAAEGQSGLRTFNAPIVFHGADKFPEGGKFPPPSYPWKLQQQGVQGSLAVTIHVEPSGVVKSVSVYVGSGSKELDEHTAAWVKKRWRFPPSDRRKAVYWVCHYKLDRNFRLPTQTPPPAALK